MKDAVLLLSGFVGGLFLGYLTAIIALFVWQLIQEGVGDPKEMAIPAIALLGIFGTALAYLAAAVFQSWPVFIGSAISFTNGVRALFKQAE